MIRKVQRIIDHACSVISKGWMCCGKPMCLSNERISQIWEKVERDIERVRK